MTQKIIRKVTGGGAEQLRMLRMPLWLGVVLVMIQVSWLTFSKLQQPTLADSSRPLQVEMPTQPEWPVNPPEAAQLPVNPVNVDVPDLDEPALTSDVPEVDFYARLARMRDNAVVQSVRSAMVESLIELTRPAADFGISSGNDTTELVNDLESAVASDPSSAHVLVLANAQDRVGTISFLVDGEVHTLAPGESCEFGDEVDHVVRFHRGSDFGQALHELSSGHYRFNVTSNGWTLSEAP